MTNTSTRAVTVTTIRPALVKKLVAARKAVVRAKNRLNASQLVLNALVHECSVARAEFCRQEDIPHTIETHQTNASPSRRQLARTRILDAESAVEDAKRLVACLAEALHSKHVSCKVARDRILSYDSERVAMPPSVLPDELMLQIFEHVDDGPRYADWSRAIVMSHINRRLRQLAINTSSLWTTIDSRFGPAFARVFASRARSRPLHILVYEHDYIVDTDDFEESIIWFVNAVVPFASRWSTFTVDTKYTHTLSAVFTALTRAAEGGRLTRITPDSISLRILRQPEKHKYLWADGGALHGILSSRKLILQGITGFPLSFLSSATVDVELQDMHVPPSYFYDILQCCPNLRKLRISSTYEPDAKLAGRTRDLEQDEAIEHQLETLILDRICFDDLPPFYMLDLPCLKALHVAYVGSAWDFHLAMNGIPRKTPVVELSIRRWSQNDYSVWTYSDETDEVITRWPGPMRCDDNDNEQFGIGFDDEPITARSRTEPVCPALRSLSFESTLMGDEALIDLYTLPKLTHLSLNIEPHITIDGLRDLLVRRIQNNKVTAISHLEVLSCEQLRANDLAKIEELVPEVVWHADYDSASDEEYSPGSLRTDDDSGYDDNTSSSSWTDTDTDSIDDVS